MRKSVKTDEKNQIIFHHNNLVEARYRLNIQEKRIIVWLSSQVKKDDKDFKKHTITIKEFADILGVSSSGMYTVMRNITKDLMKKILEIYKEDEQKLVQVAWIGYAAYSYKEGLVSLSFHPALKDFFLNLKECFTSFDISKLMSLKSIYSIRMYELLKQYEKIGERYFEIKDLREMMGLSSLKLKLYGEFKRDVLEISRRELGLKTDICFTFEEIKTSRKVTALRFFIYKNDPQKNAIEDERKEKIKKLKAESSSEYEKEKLLELKFSMPTIRKFLSQFSSQQINQALQVTFYRMEKESVDTPKAYFTKALKEGWSLSKFVEKKTS